jgi:putative oxidoreductase
MFPVGSAGVALFILRVSVAVTLMADGTSALPLAASSWGSPILLVIAILLFLGLFTPYCAVGSGLVHLASLASGRQAEFHVAIAALDSVVLAMLGPGAYSLDSRIFGRRVLTVPPRR